MYVYQNKYLRDFYLPLSVWFSHSTLYSLEKSLQIDVNFIKNFIREKIVSNVYKDWLLQFRSFVYQCGYRPDAHAIQHPWTTLNVRGFMVSADWISWVTVTTLIIRAIHLMEWKAVLSRNAFLPSKFPICMQLLFRIAVLSTMSHIEIRSRSFIEEVHEREREIFNRDVDFQARRYLSVLK